jgi:hypothetical protein
VACGSSDALPALQWCPPGASMSADFHTAAARGAIVDHASDKAALR